MLIFPLKRWLQEHTSASRCKYIACLEFAIRGVNNVREIACLAYTYEKKKKKKAQPAQAPRPDT
jgi:hypothetical protein